jgi:hypothetical protein
LKCFFADFAASSQQNGQTIENGKEGEWEMAVGMEWNIGDWTMDWLENMRGKEGEICAFTLCLLGIFNCTIQK